MDESRRVWFPLVMLDRTVHSCLSMGRGILTSGQLKGEIELLILSREGEGEVLARLLMDGVPVPEYNPKNLPGEMDVEISLWSEATSDTYGKLFVGRYTLEVAPLTEGQRTRALGRAIAVELVTPQLLEDLRNEGPPPMWELFNVHVLSLTKRSTGAVLPADS